MKIKNKILAGVVLMSLAGGSVAFAQPSNTPPNDNTPDATFNSLSVDTTIITDKGELTNKTGVLAVKAILDVVANTGIKTAVGTFVNSGSGYGLFANALDVAVYAVSTGASYAGYFRNSGTGPAIYGFSSANVGVQGYGGGAGTGGRFSAASGNVAYLATPNNSIEVNDAIAPIVATNPLTLSSSWTGTISDPSNALLLTRPLITTPSIPDDGTGNPYPTGMGTIDSTFISNCLNTGGENVDGTICRWPLMVNNGYSVVRAVAGGLESVLHITKSGRILNPSSQFGGAVNIDDDLTVSGNLNLGDFDGTGTLRATSILSSGGNNPLLLGDNTAFNDDRKVKVLDDLIVENNTHGFTSTDLAKDADGWFVCPNGYYAIGVRVTSTNTVNGLRCAEL